MTTPRHILAVVEQLRDVADALETSDYPSDVVLYATVGLQVVREAGPESERRALVDHLVAHVLPELKGDAREGATYRTSNGFGGPVMVTVYTGRDVEPCDHMTVLWPGEEDLDVRCVLPAGHKGSHADGPDHETATNVWRNDDDPEDPCAGGCSNPALHAEGGHDV